MSDGVLETSDPDISPHSWAPPSLTVPRLGPAPTVPRFGPAPTVPAATHLALVDVDAAESTLMLGPLGRRGALAAIAGSSVGLAVLVAGCGGDGAEQVVQNAQRQATDTPVPKFTPSQPPVVAESAPADAAVPGDTADVSGRVPREVTAANTTPDGAPPSEAPQPGAPGSDAGASAPPSVAAPSPAQPSSDATPSAPAQPGSGATPARRRQVRPPLLRRFLHNRTLQPPIRHSHRQVRPPLLRRFLHNRTLQPSIRHSHLRCRCPIPPRLPIPRPHRRLRPQGQSLPNSKRCTGQRS